MGNSMISDKIRKLAEDIDGTLVLPRMFNYQSSDNPEFDYKEDHANEEGVDGDFIRQQKDNVK